MKISVGHINAMNICSYFTHVEENKAPKIK